MTTSTLFRFAVAAAVATTMYIAPAQATEKGDLLRDANETIDALKSDPAFATAKTMIPEARALYIVPKLIKGGFIFGAEGGKGVLVKRAGAGWGAPSFYNMGSASFGLQAGLQQAKLVFIINSQAALDGIEKGNFKIGAGAGLTVVHLSSGAEGATTARGGDMVVWTSGSGAYAGISLNGSVITPDSDLNADKTVEPGAATLRAKLVALK